MIAMEDEKREVKEDVTIPDVNDKSGALPPLSQAEASVHAGWSIDENGNTYPEGGLRAWLVVLGALCSMFSGFGVVNCVGVLNAYVADNQLKGYSDSAISWVFSIYVFLVFFCGLQIGPIFDARGPRELIVIGSICMVVSTFLLGICEGKRSLKTTLTVTRLRLSQC